MPIDGWIVSTLEPCNGQHIPMSSSEKTSVRTLKLSLSNSSVWFSKTSVSTIRVAGSELRISVTERRSKLLLSLPKRALYAPLEMIPTGETALYTLSSNFTSVVRPRTHVATASSSVPIAPYLSR